MCTNMQDAEKVSKWLWNFEWDACCDVFIMTKKEEEKEEKEVAEVHRSDLQGNHPNKSPITSFHAGWCDFKKKKKKKKEK